MTDDFPGDDAIGRSKRILAMVDIYHERPDRMNRSALRGALLDEFTELLKTATAQSPRPIYQVTNDDANWSDTDWMTYESTEGERRIVYEVPTLPAAQEKEA